MPNGYRRIIQRPAPRAGPLAENHHFTEGKLELPMTLPHRDPVRKRRIVAISNGKLDGESFSHSGALSWDFSNPSPAHSWQSHGIDRHPAAKHCTIGLRAFVARPRRTAIAQTAPTLPGNRGSRSTPQTTPDSHLNLQAPSNLLQADETPIRPATHGPHGHPSPSDAGTAQNA